MWFTTPGGLIRYDLRIQQESPVTAHYPIVHGRHRFGLDGIDGHSRMIGGTANAVFAFPGVSAARPYLIGGLGLYNGKTTITGLGSSDSQTKFGINAGAGFDFGLGKAKLFAEGRFHAIMKGTVDPTTGAEKAAYMIPLTVGLRF